MPGSVSRDTFDKTKHYKRVQFIPDRRIFDAELNELQQIIDWRRKELIAGLGGFPGLDDELAGGVIGKDTGTFADPGVDYQVGIRPGFVVGRGDIVLPTGRTYLSESTPDNIVVFDSGDAHALQAVVYYDIYETVVDSVGDTNLIDPLYAQESAQRIRLQCDLLTAKGVVDPPAPGAGHTFIKLGVITNNQPNLGVADWVAASPTRILTFNEIDTKSSQALTDAATALSTANTALVAAGTAAIDAANAATSAAAAASSAATAVASAAAAAADAADAVATADAAAAAIAAAQAAADAAQADVDAINLALDDMADSRYIDLTIGAAGIPTNTKADFGPSAFAGAELNDCIEIGPPAIIDLTGSGTPAADALLTYYAYVTVAGQIKFRIQNNTGGPANIIAGTWRFRITKKHSAW